MSIEDKLYKFLSFYNSLPMSTKYLAGYIYCLVPLSIRYGKNFNKYKQLVRKENEFSREEMENFQIEKLRGIINYAYKNVLYYKQTFRGINIDINNFIDFQALPFLTKNQIRKSTDSFLSKKYNKKELIKLSTGGSTGEPLLLYYEKGVIRTREFVYMNDQWARIGYKFGDKLAVFRSSLVRGVENSKLWEYDPIKNRWIYSSFDLTSTNLPIVIDHLRKVRPKYLYVYPSALTILANYMKQYKESPISSIKGILSGSENTFPSQIKLFKDVFNCPVFRWYGLGELSALAGSCEYSPDYHCYNTYSYVELIDENGLPVKEIGERGEIVGTTFDNYAMPLIRYRTGDYAIYGGNKCEKCGRIGLLFKEIEGRTQEKIVDRNGNIHSLGPYLFGIHEEFWANINAIQFVQEEIGKLKISVVSNSLKPLELMKYVYELFIKRFRNNFDIEINPVNEIKRTKSGKHKYLIQKLSIGDS